MTSDQYVDLVVNQRVVNNAVGSPAYFAAENLMPTLREWGGTSLDTISYSGSFAKGTAISLGTDVDLFLSVNHACDKSVRDIYWALYSFLEGRQFHPQTRNVAVRVKTHGLSVDLVPGRRQNGNTRDHTLYRRKTDTWMQTNVAEHVRLVASSGRTQEIRAMKIWRARNNVDFPSFYLELTTIAALKGCSAGRTGENFRTVLEYLGNGFAEAVVVDPVNSNNCVSEELTLEEKRTVSQAARKALGMQRWECVVW
jgi:tRNA nucleotidyltransferase (CCA-adding enzyme)